MAQAEIILFWVTIFLYVGAFCIHLFGFVSRKIQAAKLAVWIMWAGLLFHTATAVIRWVAGAHPPVTDVYELNLTGTWFTVLVFLIFEKLGKLEKSIGLVVIPVTFLVLGFGFMSRTEVVPMGPAFQSPWLVVHVIFAWLAFGCYVISTGAAVLLLLRKKRPTWRPALKIPEPEILDLTSYRFIILGFTNHAIMLVSGAIWAKLLWGQYWSWDPLETWSLISFLYFAFYLHARSFLGWKMRRAAWLVIIGLLIVGISFWGVGWFVPSVHPGI